jgi:hypothetical protein
VTLGNRHKKRVQTCLTWVGDSPALTLMSCNGQDFGFLQPTPEDLWNRTSQIIGMRPSMCQSLTLLPKTFRSTTFLPGRKIRSSLRTRPRSGRELEVFYIANAFLQNASVNAVDCDVSMEISQTADKNSPRMIVETPVG